MVVLKVMNIIVGKSEALLTREKYEMEASEVFVEDEPPPKKFTKKCVNIPTLDSYVEEEVKVNKEWWACWTKNPLGQEYNGPKLNSEEVRKVAIEVGYGWDSKVEEICKVMDDGANLGIVGEGRWSTKGVNTDSAIQDGEKLMDSLQASIELGHIKGPLDEEEVKGLGEIKVIPIDTRPKPNGACRIIINMSHPHTKMWDEVMKEMREAEVGDGLALSPNMGNKTWRDFEECIMSSNIDFRRALYLCGREAIFCKSDWAHAYKHVPVRREDWPMQVLQFGGKYFCETALTFGGSNSPSIFRMVASFVKEAAEKMVGFKPILNCMVLDDLCSVGPKNDQVVKNYFAKYRELSKRLGVELAPLDDPGKAFPPCTKGEILGLIYDTEAWVWSLPDEKGRRLLALLWKVMKDKGSSVKTMLTLMGRLNHYMDVIGGRFERGFLYSGLRGLELCPDAWVKLDQSGLVQLWWWIVNIRRVLAVGSPLLDPRRHFAAASVVLCSDAAGGNSTKWKGWGAYCMETDEFIMHKWPQYVLKNTEFKGERWGSKLTLLEGFAAFMAMMNWLPEIRRRGSVILRVDNIGFCYAFRKGHSRDLFIYTLVKAIVYISQQLEFRVHIVHVPRRTSVGDEIVDHLSKGEIVEVMKLRPGARSTDIKCQYLLNWIRQPKVLWDMGRQIMLSLDDWKEFVGLDYKVNMRAISLKMKWVNERKRKAKEL